MVGWGRRDSFWLRWCRLGVLEPCFPAGFVETDVLLVETDVWLPLGAADGRWLPRFDKKSRTPNGQRCEAFFLGKVGVLAFGQM